MLKELEVKVLTAMSMQTALEIYEVVTGTIRRPETGIEFAQFAQVQPAITQALLKKHRRLYSDSSAEEDIYGGDGV